MREFEVRHGIIGNGRQNYGLSREAVCICAEKTGNIKNRERERDAVLHLLPTSLRLNNKEIFQLWFSFV